jgi:hypothetical protein
MWKRLKNRRIPRFSWGKLFLGFPLYPPLSSRLLQQSPINFHNTLPMPKSYEKIAQNFLTRNRSGNVAHVRAISESQEHAKVRRIAHGEAACLDAIRMVGAVRIGHDLAKASAIMTHP